MRLTTRLRSGQASVQELTESLGAVQQNISQHRAILYKAGIVDRRKVGTRVYYELRDATTLEMLDAARVGLAQRSQELIELNSHFSGVDEVS